MKLRQINFGMHGLRECGFRGSALSSTSAEPRATDGRRLWYLHPLRYDCPHWIDAKEWTTKGYRTGFLEVASFP